MPNAERWSIPTAPERATEAALIFLCLLAYPSPAGKGRQQRMTLFDAARADLIRQARKRDPGRPLEAWHSELLDRFRPRRMLSRLLEADERIQKRLAAAELIDFYGREKWSASSFPKRRAGPASLHRLLEYGSHRLLYTKYPNPDVGTFSREVWRPARPVLHMAIALRTVMLETIGETASRAVAEGLKFDQVRARVRARVEETYRVGSLITWPNWVATAVHRAESIARRWPADQARHPAFAKVSAEQFIQLVPDDAKAWKNAAQAAPQVITAGLDATASPAQDGSSKRHRRASRRIRAQGQRPTA